MTQTIVEPLDGIDLDSTPPCEILNWSKKPCGQPSAWRIKVTCPEHGTGIGFICQDCLEQAGKWGLYHGTCPQMNLPYTLI